MLCTTWNHYVVACCGSGYVSRTQNFLIRFLHLTFFCIKMLISGRGWRRPSSRSVVSLRYAFISTPWEECAVQSILEAVECWSTITVWLLPLVLRSSVILPNQQEDESELRRAIHVGLSHLGRSSETCPGSLLPLLPQTIVHCFCIAAKTMTQGAAVILLFFVYSAACFLLLSRRNVRSDVTLV